MINGNNPDPELPHQNQFKFYAFFTDEEEFDEEEELKSQSVSR